MESEKISIIICCIFMPILIGYLIKESLKYIKRLKKFDLSQKMTIELYNDYNNTKIQVGIMVGLTSLLFLLFIAYLIYWPKILTGIYDNNYIIQKCEITGYSIERSRNHDRKKISCENNDFNITETEFLNQSGHTIEDDQIGKSVCIKYYPDINTAEVLKLNDDNNFSCEEYNWIGKNINDTTNYNYSVVKCEISELKDKKINCRIDNILSIRNIELLDSNEIKTKDKICLKYYWNNNTGKVLYVNNSNKIFNCDDYLKQEDGIRK